MCQNETEEEHIERLYQNWVKEQEQKTKRQLQDVQKRQRKLETSGMPSQTAYALAAAETLLQEKPVKQEVDLKPEDFKGDLWSAIRKVKRKMGEP
jgi:O6-methylguanine-DNA--protein-cysteine methyltransferase